MDETKSGNNDGGRADEQAAANAPVHDDAIEVEAERMEEPAYRFGHRAGTGEAGPGVGLTPGTLPKAPIIAGWICLFIAWFFFASQIPFTVLVALPFDLAAIVLGLVCLSRARLGHGLAILLLATVGSLLIYLVSLTFFVGGIALKP